VRVLRVARPTPRLARVTLTGHDLAGLAPGGPADSLKVTFPAPGQESPSMPARDDDGHTVYTPEQEKQPRRAYTIRRWDRSRVELDLDVVLHGHGPGAAWAARARPGDQLVIADPRMPYKVDPALTSILLAGDEAGLPAIATILEELPANARAHVFVEVYDRDEEQALPSKAAVDITWLHRRSDTDPTGRLLAATLNATTLPKADKAWVACEAAAMREVRRHLIFDLGMDRTAVATQGYWKYGSANHSDHDMGTDV
jgi:NADPH-dependent ferric siderophore reductase